MEIHYETVNKMEMNLSRNLRVVHIALIRWNPTMGASPIRRWSRGEAVLDTSVPILVEMESADIE